MKTVERLTGLNRNTITTWERRYDLISPGRDSSGYRVYSPRDVDLLRRVKSLLDDGFAIRDAIQDARRQPAVDLAPPQGIDGLRDALRDALMRFDRRAADAVHERMIDVSFRTRLESVYLPLLAEVGDAWAVGEATIAQEHVISAFCRDQLGAMLQQLEQGPVDGTVAVCAGYPGEPHEIALLAAAVQLALRGFRVVWLGVDLPLDDLVRAAAEVDAELVCHSCVQPGDPAILEPWLAQLRARVGPETWIVIGGPGVRDLATQVPGVLLCPTFDAFVSAWEARGSL